MEDLDQARRAAQVEDSQGRFYDHISLGEGYDCELCGWSSDSLSIEQMDGGTYYIHRSSGCYGGWGEEYPLEEAIERLERFKTEELSGKVNKKSRYRVNHLIEDMRKHETNGR